MLKADPADIIIFAPFFFVRLMCMYRLILVCQSRAAKMARAKGMQGGGRGGGAPQGPPRGRGRGRGRGGQGFISFFRRFDSHSRGNEKYIFFFHG